MVGVILYRCTPDGEPDYPCEFQGENIWSMFEVPSGDTEIEVAVRAFLGT